MEFLIEVIIGKKTNYNSFESNVNKQAGCKQTSFNVRRQYGRKFAVTSDIANHLWMASSL